MGWLKKNYYIFFSYKLFFNIFREKADAEDHDITDIHHHLGEHHKVR